MQLAVLQCSCCGLVTWLGASNRACACIQHAVYSSAPRQCFRSWRLSWRAVLLARSWPRRSFMPCQTRLAKRCIKSMWNQLGSVGACVAWRRLHLLQNRRPQSGAATVPKAAPDQSLRPARRRHFFESHPMLAVCHQLSQSPGVSASQAVVDVLGALEVEAHVVLRGALRERRGREGWQTTRQLWYCCKSRPPSCCSYRHAAGPVSGKGGAFPGGPVAVGAALERL